jgi:hypothetical protein
LATILAFPTTFGGKPVERPTTAAGPVKVGLFPLGSEDVVVSTALFQIILAGLERGTAAERLTLAEGLRQAFRAFFV